MNKKKILIVCRGNIARSPFAEILINKELVKHGLVDKYVAISRGIQGTWIDPEMVRFPNITMYVSLYKRMAPVLKRFGVDISSHYSKTIDEKIVSQSSLILAMDSKTKSALISLFPNTKDKIHHFSELVGSDADIEDLALISSDDYLKVFTNIEQTVSKGFPNLLKILNHN